MEAKVLSLSERRLPRLFRRAALQHIRRELRDTAATLQEAEFVLLGEIGTERMLPFVREWAAAVAKEREGLSPPTAPAAWIHLAQELSSVLESGGDWASYLESRWRIESGRIGWSRRLCLGILGALAFAMTGLVATVLVRHAWAGNWDGLAVGAMVTLREKTLAFALIFARVAGTALMAEQGFLWTKRAFLGKEEEPRVLFLSAGDGLALAEPPSF